MEPAEARGYLQGLLRGAREFTCVAAGINAGLFDAIGRHGEVGVEPEALAQELTYFTDYVRVWCQTAYALRLLDLVDGHRFRLGGELGPLLDPEAPGSLVTSFRLRALGVQEQLDLPELLRTGAVRPRSENRQRANVRAESRSRDAERSRVAQIYRSLPAVADRLGQGGRLLEVGCGTGALLQVLAEEFPAATFVGIDLDGLAIEVGAREAAASPWAGRIRLEARGAHEIDFREEFDLVSLNIVLHELLPDIRPRAVSNMWRALRPGGVLISNDMYYPSRLEDFRRPEHLNAIHDQAMEVVWGHRHLTREQLAELFGACGFRRSEFHVITLTGAMGENPQLTALAFK